ncbi:hypothetical protein COV12_03310 [Candidatus Woesearchaeota archaeon CG10_big_fil_rev_8_21_14_0_10_32_24]|nr:MAG: hypothetical protein COV12_03310 [Candidatus Woesearchaeota archaeon CG10_big_fil_rev_8_21_14_0_10_32_24]
MILNALLIETKTLEDELQEHLVEGKRYARLGVFIGINFSALDEERITFYNFQKTPQGEIFGYHASQILTTHPLILYN